MRVRTFKDAANPLVTIADIAAGITNPSATGAAVLAAQQPVLVPGAPIDYTPILIGGSALVLLCLFLKQRRPRTVAVAVTS